MSSEVPAVVARGLGKRYGDVLALEGLDLVLERGECVGLLGANGSGKSTTLRLVLGLDRPSAGGVEVLGGEAGRREARAQTGYVPEEARRFGRLTGLETVTLFATLQGVGPRRDRRRRVEEALSDVGLARESWRRRLSTYSRGMARRLALAAAWVHRPALLVLDEPTSGLDPIGTEEIVALLDRQRREGRSSLLSTHDRLTAEGACDRAIVLSGGRPAAHGTLAELVRGDDGPSLAPLLRRAADA
jgi:ABC-type multidrug transport system ATPase subunit